MKFLCWFLPHKWEQTYQFNAETGPMSNGTLVFYKCARCGKIKMDFKANVAFGQSSINASSATLPAPSVMRNLTEAADGNTPKDTNPIEEFVAKEKGSTEEKVSNAA